MNWLDRVIDFILDRLTPYWRITIGVFILGYIVGSAICFHIAMYRMQNAVELRCQSDPETHCPRF